MASRVQPRPGYPLIAFAIVAAVGLGTAATDARAAEPSQDDAVPSAASPPSGASAMAAGLFLPPDLPVAEAPSLSIGDGVRGELRGGVELPRRAPGLWRLSVVSARNTGWATRDLVSLILRVATKLQTIPSHVGVPLRVGNLSLRHGGEMRWSHSHRAGRDVDLLLYLTDEQGTPLHLDEFVEVGRAGQGKLKRQPVFFDVPRNWHAVRALLQDGHVQVQQLFLAEPLRQMLLAHARATGEPEWLIQRARLVLSEPPHAGRHDDHLHVRLYCSRDDRLAGCSDSEPRWPWVQGFDHEVRRQVGHLVAELGEPAVERRIVALNRLAWFRHDRRTLESLVWSARTDVPEVQATALQALVQLEDPATFAPLVHAARHAADALQALALLDAAIQGARPEHAAELFGMLAPDCGAVGDRLDPAQRSALRAAVARAVRPWLLEESAEPLLGVLTDADPTTRRSALRSLEHLANRRFRTDGAAVAWHENAGRYGRLAWMYEGFAARGIAVHAPPDQLAPALIDLLDARDGSLAANAQALLQRVVGVGPGDAGTTAVRRQRAWARWWDVNRHRYEFGEAVRRGAQARAGEAVE